MLGAARQLGDVNIACTMLHLSFFFRFVYSRVLMLQTDGFLLYVDLGWSWVCLGVSSINGCLVGSASRWMQVVGNIYAPKWQ